MSTPLASRPLSVSPTSPASRTQASRFICFGCRSSAGSRRCRSSGRRKRPSQHAGRTLFFCWPTISATTLSVPPAIRSSSTPNIDRLAAQGCRFPNHFVTTSICCVSRASILSGQYARRHGINDFGQPLTAGRLVANLSGPAPCGRLSHRTGRPSRRRQGDSRRACSTTVEILSPAHGAYFEPGDPTHLTAHHRQSGRSNFIDTCSPDEAVLPVGRFLGTPCRRRCPARIPARCSRCELYDEAIIPAPVGADDATFRLLPDFVQRSEGRRRWQPRYATAAMFQQHRQGLLPADHRRRSRGGPHRGRAGGDQSGRQHHRSSSRPTTVFSSANVAWPTNG